MRRLSDFIDRIGGLFHGNPDRGAPFGLPFARFVYSRSQWTHFCSPESCCWKAGRNFAIRETGRFTLDEINDAVFRVTGAGVQQLAEIDAILSAPQTSKEKERD